MKFDNSRKLQRRAHQLIPGGCHTYAKGDDQYPELAPGFLVSGQGCMVTDVDGNEFIEYGMGLRSVSLGHAYPAVVEAASRQMHLGNNFTRPSPVEVEAAELLLGLIDGAEQVKFAKDGSSTTTAAVKLARAHTGRELIAACADHPFYSYDDWFFAINPMNAGIPKVLSQQILTFAYNDIGSVERLFAEHSGQIACLILEPARLDEPADGFLEALRELCTREGTVLIFDETITGFRWHLKGAQHLYGVTPDLSIFGKGLANGFSVSALAGKREIMDLGGLHHDRERVFLLSATHGAENHGLAAAAKVMEIYKSENVIETLYRQGQRLADGVEAASAALGLSDHVGVIGRACNLVYYTRDNDGQPSQPFRTLFLQELIRGGVIAPSFVVSYSHTDAHIDRTIAAVESALSVYRKALDEGVDKYLVGESVKPVYRKFN